MEKLVLQETQKIWNKIAKNKTPGDLKLEVEIYKKLINIFHVGDYYYMIFNPPQRFLFLNELVYKVKVIVIHNKFILVANKPIIP